MAEFASKYWSPVTEALKTLAAGKQGDGATLGQIKEQVRKQAGCVCNVGQAMKFQRPCSIAWLHSPQ